MLPRDDEGVIPLNCPGFPQRPLQEQGP
jgi:hypothetical protein